MATTFARPRHWAGSGAFYVGMSLIVAATVLNVAYDQLPGVGPRMMPEFLAQMYDASGKMGVTTVFVAAGLSFILFGFALPRGRREQLTSNRPLAVPIAAPLFTAEDGAEDSDVTASGAVVLRTRKYLSPSAGLSGVTGWASPRRDS